MLSVPFESCFGKGGFTKISRAFLDDPSLAFAKVLPAEVIEKTFRKYDSLFGGDFFNTVFVLWAFLSQTLSDGKSRSCSTAVGRIAAFCFALGQAPPDSDNGNYCRARAKLSIKALHELVMLTAKNTESMASTKWLWQGKHHAKLVDGFTATMPDTPKNQAKYPQHGKQAPGCGFPIMRVCVVLCCRWPQRWCLTRHSQNTPAKKPASRRCCVTCFPRSIPATLRCLIAIAVRT
jgi:hypothetical protein